MNEVPRDLLRRSCRQPAMLDERRPALVAVIEDDESARAALGRVLQAGGFEPVLFDSAEAFISSPPTAALRCLIVDVQLTGMSGLDLQMKLRSEGFDVPVIIVHGQTGTCGPQACGAGWLRRVSLEAVQCQTILALLASIGRQSRS